MPGVAVFIVADVALHGMGLARLLAAEAEVAVAGASPPGPDALTRIGELEPEIVLLDEAGICGYVTPEASAEQLASTIASVARGELPCSARIAGTLMRRVASLASAPAPAPPLYALTRRERQVVELVAQGLSNKEIAHCLAIEVTTVKTHVHHLLEKLRLRRRGELAALAHEAGDNGAARTP